MKTKTQSKKAISVIITDTHLDTTNIELNKSIHHQARQLAVSLGLKVVDHGGDLLESRKSQPQDVLTAFGEILDEYSEDDIELHSTVGNHDKVDYSSYDSYLDAFQHHPSFELHKSFDSRALNESTYLHYAAFIEDDLYIQDLKEHIEEYRLNDVTNMYDHILLTHIGVNAAVMNNGMKIASEVTTELFKPFKRVFIGHYHDIQNIGENIHYIGAAYQQNFGEGPLKGATVLYDDLSFELVPFQFPAYLTEVINLSHKEMTIEKLQELKDLRGEGNYVRAVLYGKEEDVKSANVQNLKDLGIKVVKEQEVLVQSEIAELVQVFDDKSLKEAFVEFCTANKLNHEEGSKYLNKII